MIVRRIPEITQYQQDRLLPVRKDPKIQWFTSKNSGLSTIMIYLRNKALQNTQPFTFSLNDSSGKTIRKIEINGKNIGDGSTVRFQFDPIIDSQNKKYQISVVAQNTTINDPYIEVGVSNTDTILDAYIENEPGDFTMETFYKPISKREQIVMLKDELLQKLNTNLLFVVVGLGLFWFTGIII